MLLSDLEIEAICRYTRPVDEDALTISVSEEGLKKVLTKFKHVFPESFLTPHIEDLRFAITESLIASKITYRPPAKIPITAKPRQKAQNVNNQTQNVGSELVSRQIFILPIEIPMPLWLPRPQPLKSLAATSGTAIPRPDCPRIPLGDVRIDSNVESTFVTPFPTSTTLNSTPQASTGFKIRIPLRQVLSSKNGDVVEDPGAASPDKSVVASTKFKIRLPLKRLREMEE